MASGRFLDYHGQGLAASRPVAATLAASVLAGAGVTYFATDTNILSVLDIAATSWIEFTNVTPDAGDIAFTPAGAIAATDVQAAIEELDSEKASIVYVDNKVAGLSWKQAVRVATTAALTLASDFENGDTIDGVVIATGDRVLNKDASAGVENGIYIINASGAPTRATDADNGAELVNASVYVSEGTTLADTQWTCTTNAPITVGVTSLAFAQLSSGGTTFASTTEQLTGTEAAKSSSPDTVAALWEQGSDIASAGTISIGEGGYFNITGTTTITDIDFATDKAGRKVWVKFAGVLTLTHNASTLILPTGASITTAAGDMACFVSEGSDAVRCLTYQRASGEALTGGGSSASKVTPKGRLTLVSNTPVLISDQLAKTAIYYTPYIGDTVPIYSGAAWDNKTFAELTLNLDTSNHLLETVYDAFIWNDAGTIKIGSGPAWNHNATITVTIATPAVVSWTAHGLNEGDAVVFTTSGALPTGITAGTTYYVGRSPGADSFNISTSRANAAAGTFVATSGSQSGTHTCTCGIRLRGTGAGTTELELKNGTWTNKNSITLKNGAGAGTSGIAANTATYVGSFYCTANGQTGMAFKPSAAAGGTNNVLGLFNAYNRCKVSAKARDNTASWTYNVVTWRAANNSVSNRISLIDGLAEVNIFAVNQQTIGPATSSAANIGINFDNTNGNPEVAPQFNGPSIHAATVKDTSLASLGLRYAQQMEVACTTGTQTFYGLESSPVRQHAALIVEVEI